MMLAILFCSIAGPRPPFLSAPMPPVALGAFVAKGSWADDEPEEETAPPPAAPVFSNTVAPHSSGGNVSGGNVSGGKPIPSSGPWILFVANLPFDAVESALESHFEDCGVLNVRLVRHRDTGRVRNAYVELKDADGLRKALTHDGKNLSGRPLRLDVGEARRNEASAGASGGAHAGTLGW